MPLKRKDICFPVELFYDGQCPICMKEINWLRKNDKWNRLVLVDIQQDNFENTYPEFDFSLLDQKIHARMSDGSVVTGVDATLASWEAINKGFWIAPLRWPVIRFLADQAYLLFANNRHSLARRFAFLLGHPSCPVKTEDKK